jgi:hypothetical protein
MAGVQGRSLPLRQAPSLRRDAWWAAPLATALGLAAFTLYFAWAVLQGGDYYAAPYLSPLYSPFSSPNWLWIPVGLRATCYYYRKAYYRSFFWTPPACAMPDARTTYKGETGWLRLVQNAHRYFFYLSVLLLAFLWRDALLAFRFADGFGVGVGSLVLAADALLLTLFLASCNSCRHVCGGHLKSLHQAPVRHGLWRIASRLNVRHAAYGWLSLGSVAFADLYVRLLSTGVIHELRLL